MNLQKKLEQLCSAADTLFGAMDGVDRMPRESRSSLIPAAADSSVFDFAVTAHSHSHHIHGTHSYSLEAFARDHTHTDYVVAKIEVI